MKLATKYNELYIVNVSNFNSFKKVLRDRRGYSAIIALALSLVIMYFAIDVAQNTVDQRKKIQAFNDSGRAYFLADSFIRNLMSEGKGYDAGWNVEPGKCGFDPEEDFNESTGTFVNTEKQGTGFMNDIYENYTESDKIDQIKKIKIKCSVVGVTGKIGDEYVVPSPNTGDAGKDCGSITASEAMHEINHSCNWGRLNFGNQYSSRVAVPLYYYEGAGAVNPWSDLTSGGLKIKVRTPCKPVDDAEGHRVFVTECADTERYELDADGTLDAPETDETVVNWQIDGECEVGSTKEACALIPWMARDTDRSRRLSLNSSEIYESLINDQTEGFEDYVIEENKTGVDLRYWDNIRNQIEGGHFNFNQISILSFLTNASDGYWANEKLYSPRLQLALTAMNLLAPNNEKVPYLEYQIISDVPISNNATKYMVEVQYNGQAYKIERSIPQPKDLIDFAIQN